MKAKIKKLFTWLEMAILVLVLPVFTYTKLAAMGKQVYVAKTGSDKLENGSKLHPYLTINFAASKLSRTGGDTVFIKAGTYHEKVFSVISGTPGNPNIITNYDDEKVTITGDNSREQVIFLKNKHDITIRGLNIVDTSRSVTWRGGVHLEDSHRIVIENNTISRHAEKCVYVHRSHHCIIRNNLIHEAGRHSCINVAGGYSNLIEANSLKDCGYGLTLYYGSYNNIVRNNLISNERHPGSGQHLIVDGSNDNLLLRNVIIKEDKKYETFGIVLRGYFPNVPGAWHNIVLNNRISGQSRGIVLDDSARVNLLIGNLVYNSGGGIEIEGSSYDNRFYNNTIAGLVDGTRLKNPAAIWIYNGKGNKFYNNSVMTHKLSLKVSPNSIEGTEVGYNNLFHMGDKNLVEWGRSIRNQPLGPNSISADPAYIDPAVGNFELSPDSPNIDAGTNPGTDFDLVEFLEFGPNTDPYVTTKGDPCINPATIDACMLKLLKENMPRHQGASFDIGAFEFEPKSPAALLFPNKRLSK